MIYLWLEEDLGEAGGGEKAGLVEGRGVQRKRGSEGVPGAGLASLAQLGMGGSPIQALFSKAGERGRKKEQPLSFGTSAEGMWQLVALLLT